jgi:hypothetical protein
MVELEFYSLVVLCFNLCFEFDGFVDLNLDRLKSFLACFHRQVDDFQEMLMMVKEQGYSLI